MQKRKNKTAFITGGASGIGLETARQLLAEKYCICVLSKSIPKDPLVREFFEQDDVVFVRGDISRQGDVKRAIATCLKSFGRIDVLVNNAAIAQSKLFERTTQKDWELLLRVNILGTLFVTKTILPIMKKQKTGCIVNISSGAGVYGIGGLSLYSLTKAALINFTQSLAQEVSGLGIRVLSVAPGSTDTRMFQSLFPDKKAHHTAGQVAQVIVRAIKKDIEPDSKHIIDVFYHQR